MSGPYKTCDYLRVKLFGGYSQPHRVHGRFVRLQALRLNLVVRITPAIILCSWRWNVAIAAFFNFCHLAEGHLDDDPQ
jgi:hypothetical protein